MLVDSTTQAQLAFTEAEAVARAQFRARTALQIVDDRLVAIAVGAAAWLA